MCVCAELWIKIRKTSVYRWVEVECLSQVLTLSLQCFSVQIKQKITKTWTLFSNNVNTTIRKYSSRAFIWVVTPLGFVGQFVGWLLCWIVFTVLCSDLTDWLPFLIWCSFSFHQAIAESGGYHFMVLFKDGLKFRGLYSYNPESDQVRRGTLM